MASTVLSRGLLLRAGLGAGALGGLAPLVAARGGSGAAEAPPPGPADGAPKLTSDQAHAAPRHLVEMYGPGQRRRQEDHPGSRYAHRPAVVR